LTLSLRRRGKTLRKRVKKLPLLELQGILDNIENVFIRLLNKNC